MKGYGQNLGAAALALTLSGAAQAQAPAPQRAAAEAMFQQATQLMDQRRFAEACEKFAASEELEPALGTMLYLADCYDQAGRSASAWALFREVEQRARRADQADRVRIAAERAAALEPQLSKLELRVAPDHQVPGLQLFSDGSGVPAGSWNTALPVDPGKIRIEARAPGRKPWVTTVQITAGTPGEVLKVPMLALAPVAAPVAPASAPPPPTPPSSSQGTWAMVTGGVGLVALAVSGFYGYRAYARNKESRGECRADIPKACTSDGAELRRQAADAARLSTIFGIGGGVLVAGGVTLGLTVPSSPRDARATNGRQARALGGAELRLRGAW